MGQQTRTAVTVVATAGAIGIAVGVGLVVANGSGTADGRSSPSTERSSISPHPIPTATTTEHFKVNEAGQTFGSYRIGGPRPDFVPGKTDDGKDGFFFTDDWVPELDEKGAPIIAPDAKAVIPDENGDVKINVYAFDGKTILGEATISHVTYE